LDNGKEDGKIHISRGYLGGNNKKNHLKKAGNNNVGLVNERSATFLSTWTIFFSNFSS